MKEITTHETDEGAKLLVYGALRVATSTTHGDLAVYQDGKEEPVATFDLESGEIQRINHNPR
jgi:hypothetical protein